MSCRFCEHWLRPNDFCRQDDEGQQIGKCTLNPIWVDTDHKHFCSHAFYAPSMGAVGSTSMVHSNNRAMHQAQQEIKAARTERVRLEKVAKDLRAKLREKGRA